jgi:hypothetical protein
MISLPTPLTWCGFDRWPLAGLFYTPLPSCEGHDGSPPPYWAPCNLCPQRAQPGRQPDRVAGTPAQPGPGVSGGHVPEGRRPEPGAAGAGASGRRPRVPEGEAAQPPSRIPRAVCPSGQDGGM